MAHVRKGQLTASGEWRKHLRFWKRFFWKAERQEARRQAKEEARHEAKARPSRRAFDLRSDASTQRVMAGRTPPVMAGLVPATTKKRKRGAIYTLSGLRSRITIKAAIIVPWDDPAISQEELFLRLAGGQRFCAQIQTAVF